MIEAYLRDCERRGLSPKTVRVYGERLALLAREHPGRRVQDLSRDELQRWIDARGGPASRAAHRSTVVQLWRWMVDEGHAPVNVALRCRAPVVRAGRPRPIDNDELVRVATVAPPKIRAALWLGALAGLRVAEMAALRWRDVHLPGHVLEVVEGKGGRSRVVPMHDTLEAALVGLGPARRGTVLVTRAGGPYAPRELGQRISGYLRRNGVDATAHQLRHTFGTAVYVATRDIRVTSKLLGHASVVTTETYARFDLPPAAFDAVRGLSA